MPCATVQRCRRWRHLEQSIAELPEQLANDLLPSINAHGL